MLCKLCQTRMMNYKTFRSMALYERCDPLELIKWFAFSIAFSIDCNLFINQSRFYELKYILMTTLFHPDFIFPEWFHIKWLQRFSWMCNVCEMLFLLLFPIYTYQLSTGSHSTSLSLSLSTSFSLPLSRAHHPEMQWNLYKLKLVDSSIDSTEYISRRWNCISIKDWLTNKYLSNNYHSKSHMNANIDFVGNVNIDFLQDIFYISIYHKIVQVTSSQFIWIFFQWNLYWHNLASFPCDCTKGNSCRNGSISEKKNNIEKIHFFPFSTFFIDIRRIVFDRRYCVSQWRKKIYHIFK